MSQKRSPYRKIHHEKRMKLVTNWIEMNHSFQKTVFSDEKSFSLDEPDNWSTWIKSHDGCAYITSKWNYI